MSSGCRAKNAGSNGTMRRTPYSGGKATRSNAGEPVGAARRALRLFDREQGVAGANEQRLAGVGGGDLPGGADEKLDAQSALERRNGARHGGLGQAEFARGLGEASALDRSHEQGELQQPIIHTKSNISYCIARNTYRACASLSFKRIEAPGANPGRRARRTRSMAMGELSGKVAIVTGASKGIGAAIARRFGRSGGGGRRQLCVGQGRRRPDRRGNQARRRQGGRDPGECLKERRRQAPVRRDQGEARRAQHPRQQRGRVLVSSRSKR